MNTVDFVAAKRPEPLPQLSPPTTHRLPFGIIKMDFTGVIVDYSPTAGEITEIEPTSAIGKNFFDDVALHAKTQVFYRHFSEGIKKGFINVIFEFAFHPAQHTADVRIHMFTLPDSSGKKTVVLLVKKLSQPRVAAENSNLPQSPANAAPPAQFWVRGGSRHQDILAL